MLMSFTSAYERILQCAPFAFDLVSREDLVASPAATAITPREREQVHRRRSKQHYIRFNITALLTYSRPDYRKIFVAVGLYRAGAPHVPNYRYG